MKSLTKFVVAFNLEDYRDDCPGWIQRTVNVHEYFDEDLTLMTPATIFRERRLARGLLRKESCHSEKPTRLWSNNRRINCLNCY